MVYRKNTIKRYTKIRGFTLVEMLIIAPIVILVIGIFVSTIINMTGAVLASRGANALSYSINNALTRIDQDVKASAGFLSTNNISLTSGQGLDSGTGIFKNATTANGNMLILNSYATDQNPLTPTRNIINAAISPYTCGSTYVSQNSKLMTNIVYFVTNNTLWRRVIMPSNYNNTGGAGGGCATPWQKPTCSPGYSATFCQANDQLLVSGVSSFTVNYYTSAAPTVPIVNASDPNQTDNNRQTAMQTASSVYVTITATKTLSGRNISQTGSIRSLGIQTPTMLTQPTNQTVVAGNNATFATAAFGTNMTTQWEQSSDNGVTWAAVSGATSSTLILSGVSGTLDGNLYHVIYTNSYGQITSSPARLMVDSSASGWNSLAYQNSWADYGGGYNTGNYMKTSSGIVVLKGVLARTGSPVASETIATLPPGYRPSAPLIFGTSTYSNVSGCIYVMPDGIISFCAGSGTWISLENIHFVADTGRYTSNPVNLFYNGWSNYGQGWANASYVVDSYGRVNTQGRIAPGTRSDGTRIFDLSSELLPANYMYVPEYGSGFAAMGINPALGSSAINDKNLGSSYLAVNAMYYPADPTPTPTWNSLSLQNGWAAYGLGTSTPQYTIATDGLDKLVSVKGLISSGTTTAGTIIATLPVGYRPSAQAIFAAYSNGAYSRIDISSGGNIIIQTGSNVWLSLDGITFNADQ